MADKSINPKDNPDFRYIVRIANSDLDGNKVVVQALTQVKGIGSRLAMIAAAEAEVPMFVKIGTLSDEQIAELSTVLGEIEEIAPSWVLNRRHDIHFGEDLHILGTDLQTQFMEDVNRLRMIRSYRGIRHETGRKCRGQRTRSNGRKGTTMGVQKKKEQPAGK